MKLAIIGTAGRGDDREKLTLAHWFAMVGLAKMFADSQPVKGFVSGGAAWADHVAVALHFDLGLPLDLYLPGVAEDQRTAFKYHSRFSQVVGRDTKAELFKASLVFGNSYLERGTFKQRNTRVADNATDFLAMTFGDGPKVKDGGTADTVRKMLDQGKTGWHLDLHDFILHPVK